MVPTLRDMVGFRNLLVHGYDTVDPAIVREVVETRLGDLEAFVDCVRAQLPPPPGDGPPGRGPA